MHSSSKKTRGQKWLVVPAVLTLVLLGVGCSEDPPPPTDPSTPWMTTDCLDSTMEGVPDVKFNGTANQKDNASAFFDDDDNFSQDGSCSGPNEHKGTIVRAVDHAAAVTACAAADTPVADPGRLADYGYTNAPIDAWACEEASAAA